MNEKRDLLRQTDEAARQQARILLRGARFGSLAVIDPQSGEPLASRVLLAVDIDGSALTLVSRLSGHTRGLEAGGTASLLVGEPGKGDPLAHPRMSVQCHVEKVGREGPDRARIKERFIRRHPKAELYVDFADFDFFRLKPSRASLNGGFGRAYALTGEDLAIDSPAIAEIALAEARVIAHMNADHADAVRTYAGMSGYPERRRWIMCGLDAAGFDIQSGDRLVRIEFDHTLRNAAEIRSILIQMLKGPR